MTSSYELHVQMTSTGKTFAFFEIFSTYLMQYAYKVGMKKFSDVLSTFKFERGKQFENFHFIIGPSILKIGKTFKWLSVHLQYIISGKN